MTLRKSKYLYLYSGAIGEALLGIHIARVLEANEPGSTICILAPRSNTFVKELVAELPFVEYADLPKEQLRSWMALPGLMIRAHKTIVLETVTIRMPVWWRIILWCARFRSKSEEVRYQMKGHERPVPRKVKSFTYACDTENYFDTPPAVLSLLGVRIKTIPDPTLCAKSEPRRNSYILFHFFAGNYRRSIPQEHAREILAFAREAFPNHHFILTCSRSEQERAERMAENIPNVSVCAGASASHMLTLLATAEVVVGTASGILLVAAHLQAPTIALSCLIHPCWLPDFSPTVTIIAAREECRCAAGGQATCVVHTPEGDFFRCLYYIKTSEVIDAIKGKLTPI